MQKSIQLFKRHREIIAHDSGRLAQPLMPLADRCVLGTATSWRECAADALWFAISEVMADEPEAFAALRSMLDMGDKEHQRRLDRATEDKA